MKCMPPEISLIQIKLCQEELSSSIFISASGPAVGPLSVLMASWLARKKMLL